MEPKEWNLRYLLLAFDCLIGFGTYFNIDLPSALQDQIQGDYTLNCSLGEGNHSLCCEKCLGLTSEQYNQLYAVFLWLSAALALPMGYFIDRIGNRVAALLSTFTTSIGSVVFALSMVPGIKHTKIMFPLLVLGRSLLGAGSVSVRICQDRLIAFWFPDRLELAFGMIVCVLRLGNVGNFLLSSNIAQWLGMEMATWIGASLCGLGFVAAIILTLLDYSGAKKVDIYVHSETSTPIKLADIRHFPLSYWMIVMMIFSFSAAYIPLVANGGEYIQEKYGFSETKGSYINGIIYDVAVFACPLVGILLNYCCQRHVAGTFGIFLLVPTLILLLITSISPIVISVMIGMVYSLITVSMWPSIAKTVPLNYVGTGNGIALTIYGIFSGLSSTLVGHLLRIHKSESESEKLRRWHNYFLFLMGCTIFSCCCSIVLNILERHTWHLCFKVKNEKEQDDDIHEKDYLIQNNVNYGSTSESSDVKDSEIPSINIQSSNHH